VTHGCLIIRRKGERRRVLLHTYHDGFAIPSWIGGAIESWALHYRYMFDLWHKRFRKSRARLEEELRYAAFADGYDYPPSAAGWVVRAGSLEPLPGAFVKDLPTWGGFNSPYQLIVSPESWRILDQEGELIEEFDAYARMVDVAWREIQEQEDAP
jgi:hypothetical protein